MATRLRVDRTLDTTDKLKLAPSGAGKSMLREMSVGDLQVDRSYQPAHRQKNSRVQYLKEHWEDVLSGALMVSHRDGGFWVFDGATRLAGARENGSVLFLPCRVFEGMTQQEEARAFRLLNQWRWAVHVVDRFNAMIVEEDPAAVRLARILADHGLKIGYSPGMEEVSAVQALEFVQLWGVLPQTLSIITEAWPDDPFARRREIVLAVGSFVYQYQDLYSEVFLKRQLRHMSPSKLVDDASVSSAQRSKWASVASEMTYLYNRAARSENRRILPRYDRPRLQRTGVAISKQADNNMPGDSRQRRDKAARRSAATI